MSLHDKKTEHVVSAELREALDASDRPFCIVGELPLGAERLTLLFTDDDGQGEAIAFPLASPAAIALLLEACKQAPFGRGQETVLDPEYRRALVLPANRLAVSPVTSIDPFLLGILDRIKRLLLAGSERRIVARLDKLNVYGLGDFFKGHVDTPQSENMFGTLLMNLPVVHKGGQLVVHAANAETKTNSSDGFLPIDASTAAVSGGTELDSAQDTYTTNWGDEQNLSWIAFYSDCPHEVLPVLNGNR